MDYKEVFSKEELLKGVIAGSFNSTTGKHESFVELVCTLDSETTKVTAMEEKETILKSGKIKKEMVEKTYSTPICFQICIGNRSLIIRKRNELFIALDYIKETLKIDHEEEVVKIDEKTGYIYEEIKIIADNILVIYVHNLGFDSSFWLWDLLKKRGNREKWLSNVFITPSNVVVSFRYRKSIEFRNSQCLTGLSLDASVEEFLGKDSKYAKQTGWNYDLVRSPKSILSKEEREYALMDVYSLSEIIKAIKTLHGYYDKDGKFLSPLAIADIPSTRTSFVKNEMRDFLYKGARSESKLWGGDNARNKIMMERAKSIGFDPTEEGLHNLELVRESYMGGVVDNNPYFSNKLISDIGSWDQSSQYLKQLIMRTFPCSKMRKKELKGVTVDSILKACDFKSIEDKRAGLRIGAIVKVTFLGVKCKKTPVPLFAVTHEELNDPDIKACGKRILYCEKLTRTLVDTDLRIFTQTYSFESCIIHEYYEYDMSPIPEILARYILKLYSQKTIYKNDADHAVTYKLRKIALCSVVGIISSYPLYDDIGLDDEGKPYKTLLTHTEKLEQLKKNSSRFEKVSMCLYMFAPYITAYAREDLYELMLKVGSDVICCDTDSFKFKYPEKYNKIFVEANKKNEILMKGCGWRWFGLTEKQTAKLMCPCDINGEVHPIGNWENEAYNEKLGKLVGIVSKRSKCYMLKYVDVSGKFNYKFVVSGINGNRIKKYAEHLIEQNNTTCGNLFINKEKSSEDITCGNLFNIKDEVDFFTRDMIIPEEWSGNLRVERFFKQSMFKYTDYQGNKWTMYNRTGTHLIPQSFSINAKEIDLTEVGKYVFENKPTDRVIGTNG